MDLTYNSTAFWAAYINYETQYAAQLHIHLLGPLLAAANASLQNTQIENLVNEGAKAIIVNPETATSLGSAISYAAAHHVQLISVDTIVGVGKVYMVVRASNTIYGLDACALISSKVNLGDPIVAPFVTKASQTLTVTPVLGLPGTVTTTPVSDSQLWGNVYGSAHGGNCSSSAA